MAGKEGPPTVRLNRGPFTPQQEISHARRSGSGLTGADRLAEGGRGRGWPPNPEDIERYRSTSSISWTEVTKKALSPKQVVSDMVGVLLLPKTADNDQVRLYGQVKELIESGEVAGTRITLPEGEEAKQMLAKQNEHGREVTRSMHGSTEGSRRFLKGIDTILDHEPVDDDILGREVHPLTAAIINYAIDRYEQTEGNPAKYHYLGNMGDDRWDPTFTGDVLKFTQRNLDTIRNSSGRTYGSELRDHVYEAIWLSVEVSSGEGVSERLKSMANRITKMDDGEYGVLVENLTTGAMLELESDATSGIVRDRVSYLPSVLMRESLLEEDTTS